LKSKIPKIKKGISQKKFSAIPTQDISSLQVTKYSVLCALCCENFEVCD